MIMCVHAGTPGETTRTEDTAKGSQSKMGRRQVLLHSVTWLTETTWHNRSREGTCEYDGLCKHTHICTILCCCSHYSVFKISMIMYHDTIQDHWSHSYLPHRSTTLITPSIATCRTTATAQVSKSIRSLEITPMLYRFNCIMMMWKWSTHWVETLKSTSSVSNMALKHMLHAIRTHAQFIRTHAVV